MGMYGLTYSLYPPIGIFLCYLESLLPRDSPLPVDLIIDYLRPLFPERGRIINDPKYYCYDVIVYICNRI